MTDIVKLAEEAERDLIEKSTPEIAEMYRKKIDQFLGYIITFIAENSQSAPYSFLSRLDNRAKKLLKIEDCLRNISDGVIIASELEETKLNVQDVYDQYLIEDIRGENHTPYNSEERDLKILVPLFCISKFLEKL